MREKPNVDDVVIVKALKEQFALAVKELRFLPIGNDANAWIYRVGSAAESHFLKLRKGNPNNAALLVPRYLWQQGISNAVSPLPTASDELFARMGEYSLILYPWIAGESKFGNPLAPRLWREWGRIMRAIHDATISPELSALVPREQFGKRWVDRLRRVEGAISNVNYQDAIARDTATAWRSQSAEIERVRARYLSLGAGFAAMFPEIVLCHADIHTANIIVGCDEIIHIVDWDEVILAPKERDLMFFLGDGHPAETEAAFIRGYGGYGDRRANKVGLAYYRYDWVMQEFCDYGERVFFSDGLGEKERAFAFDGFCQLFTEGDVVALARQAFAKIPL